ncbi:MCE family protein [Nocardioides alcanivorans]|uniref:MCE family protein n=1 Tax=Nocardioides alcanivorans TaxID=2897352 RepID=UPI001F167097|nr:MCE family protein [Nocardioides alcanivorans]
MTDVRLEKDAVVVSFQVKGVHVGDQTTAAVKVRTLLGRKYLALSPQGREDLDGRIPLARTTTPYDVNAAFSDLSDEITAIDTAKLEKSLNVLSTTFEDTPESVREMVDGLSALSRTISSRDEELASLLASTTSVTGTLKDRNDEFAKIIQDGSDLLGELENRREAVHAMLTGTARLGTELQGLVADNEKTLAPALAKLDRVSEILQRNQDHLEEALKKMGPYYRVLASATGNGHWIESYLCGLFDEDLAPLLDNDVIRNCHPKKGGGR